MPSNVFTSLQGISPALIDAARVDDANLWYRSRCGGFPRPQNLRTATCYDDTAFEWLSRAGWVSRVWELTPAAGHSCCSARLTSSLTRGAK